RAAEDERRELRPQPRQRALAIGVQRRLERAARPEQARQQEAEDAPEIELAVLERRAGEDDAMLRAHGEAGLRDLRVGVLDELALVEHGVTEVRLVEQRAMLAQLRVAREPQHRIAPLREVVSGLQH